MIEKIIHQIWVGPYKMPDYCKKYCDKIQKLHPDYKYQFYDNNHNEDLPKILQYHYDRFFKLHGYAICADLLRIYVVNKYGGLYLDVDYNITERLDQIFLFDEFYLMLYDNYEEFLIQNGVFASKKNSCLLTYGINSIGYNIDWFGPYWLTRIIKDSFVIEWELNDFDLIRYILKTQNIELWKAESFHNKFGYHDALRSWHPDMVIKFKNNTYNR